MTSQMIGILAAAGLATGGVAVASEHRSADALPGYAATAMGQESGGGGEKCRVDIQRTGASGTASVTRAVLPSGECVCTIVTGEPSNNGAAENAVNALLRDRECRDAPAARERSNSASSGRGGSGAVIGGVLGAAAIGGLAIGLGGGNDSPG